MAKALHCSDLGMSCGFTAKGETEQEVMTKAAEHAKCEHGLATLSCEMTDKVKAAIHDESGCCSGCRA